MPNPIDVIANAIRDECNAPVPGVAEGWARVAAKALTDPAVVETAMHALLNEGLYRLLDARVLDGPDGGAEVLRQFTLTVLRSVAEEA